MGLAANNFGVRDWEARSTSGVASAELIPNSKLARVIPGSARWRTRPAANGQTGLFEERRNLNSKQLLTSILPDSFRALVPEMLGFALADLILISGIFILEFGSISDSVNNRVVLFYLAIFFMMAVQCRLYSKEPKSNAAEQGAICKSLFWTCLLTLAPLSHTSVKGAFFPLVLFTIVDVAALSLSRESWRALTGPNRRSRSRGVLIVGEPDFADAVAKSIEKGGYGRRIVPEVFSEYQLRRSDGCATLQKIARQQCVDELIVASSDRDIVRTVTRLAEVNQLDLLVAPNLGSVVATGAENLDGLPLIRIHQQVHPQWELTAKRITDFVVSSLLLLLLSPLLLLIAIVIQLDSPGPILYCATRVGRKGQRFTCFKFRTMLPRAETMKEPLRALNQREGAFFKLVDDPRITRVGRVLRRYSLDELPQLWNVLLGDMSLVGPRPHPPDDVERYQVEDMRRLDFTPGMTGLWQVSARRDPSFRRCVALDVQYIREWNLLLDLQILWRTIGVVLQGSGA